MTALKELEEEKKRLEILLLILDKKIDKKLSETIVLCTNNNHGKGCGMGMYIKDLEYIQTYWYESPYGCTGGDNWYQGEGNFNCPHCGHRNRLYDRKEIQELKHLFKSTVEEYER